MTTTMTTKMEDVSVSYEGELHIQWQNDNWSAEVMMHPIPVEGKYVALLWSTEGEDDIECVEHFADDDLSLVIGEFRRFVRECLRDG